MSLNTQHDSRLLNNLYLGYNKSLSEVSDEPRIVRGQNSLVTIGGILRKRPGLQNAAVQLSSRRLDRLWEYTTIGTTPKHYLIGSFYNNSTGYWEIYYRRTNGITAWTSLGSYRDINASTRVHEVVIQKGLAYIKSFPHSSSSEKLGTVIMDGTTAVTVYPWGIQGPTTPARINASVTTTANTISTTATTIVVSANFGSMPATPFNILVIYPGQSEENMTVTGVAGTTWTVTRTVPVAHSALARVFYRNWGTSAHAVDVNVGWAYSYAYKSITGQISNRAPLETNTDLAPSNTFPFFDKIPSVTVQGHADTTNIPKIVIFRTQDGGGVFYKLEEITNTGAGNITYLDDSLGTGPSSTTFSDPLPDAVLDSGSRSPGLDTNGPPITVIAPKIVGTDTPELSTPIESYAGRFFMGIGNVLLFSAKEELTYGVGEESWPTGVNGNSEALQDTICNLKAGKNGLYLFTNKKTYKISGTNRETFSLNPLYDNIGGLFNNPRSVCRVGDRIAVVTNDYKIIIIDENDVPEVISDELGSDLITLMEQTNREIELMYYSNKDKEWLVVQIKDNNYAVNQTNNTRQWVYDLRLSKKLNKHFWNTPWNIKSSSIYAGRISESSQTVELCFSLFDATASELVKINDAIANDIVITPVIGDPGTGFTFSIDTNLFNVSSGNHVNELRSPDLTPVFVKTVIERSVTGGDADPDVYFYYDDFWTNPIGAGTSQNIVQRPDSMPYKTMQFSGDRAAYRTGIGIVSENHQVLNIYSIRLTWNPDHGS